MDTPKSDRIDNALLLRAPRSRVWHMLTDQEEFGGWFGVRLIDAFAPGARVRGTITHEGYEGITWEVVIERMEPERLLSWRWHPFAVDAAADYSAEPATLVVFELETVTEGTMLFVVESGFNQIPLARRDTAYRMHVKGWAAQMESIKQHLSKAA